MRIYFYHIKNSNHCKQTWTILKYCLLSNSAPAMDEQTHLNSSCLKKSLNVFINGEWQPTKLVKSQCHVH